MKTNSRLKTWSILLAVVISIYSSTAHAQDNSQGIFADIAMLPFADFSGDPEAKSVVISAIRRAFAATGPSLISSDSLRPILRKHRVRAVGMIDRAGAEAIVSESGVNYILAGSIDFFESGDVPAVGFSVRLIDASDMRPIYARSVSASGNEFIGLFGLGRIDDADSLAYRLAYKTADELRRFLAAIHDGEVVDSSPVTAIVPFDEIDPGEQTGAIATVYLLSRLVNEGIRVIEPGVSQALFLQMGHAPRGEIGHDLIDALRDSLGVDLIITGAVDGFASQPVGAGRSRAEISLGARLINARTRNIAAAEYVIRQSESGDGLVTGSNGYPAGRVVSSSVKEIVDRLSLVSRQAVVDSI